MDRGIAPPLRLSRERILLYGAALTVLCLVQVRFVVAQRYGDWSAFWSAGATAGTRDLLDAQRHAAWQQAHHVTTTIFPYLPAAAWFLIPVKYAPLGVGYALNFAVMAAAVLGAAFVAARAYRISRDAAGMLAFAWAPVAAALSTGQNSPAGLLLSLGAIASLLSRSWLGAGLCAGALLYKPLYAVPFVALFLLRRNARAVAVVAACACAWYLLSVAATAGDWNWPAHYLDAIRGYAGADARVNAVKAVGIPQVLLRAGMEPLYAYGSGAVLFVLALPALARMPLLEAASFAPLLALATGPHTLPYDLALALPAMFYAVSHGREPVRTRAICALYLLAPIWLLSGFLRFDVLAVLCAPLTIAWLLRWWVVSRFAGGLARANAYEEPVRAAGVEHAPILR